MQMWRHWGSDLTDRFVNDLEPERLMMDYIDYKKEFGDEFTFQDLLKIQELKSGALLVEAIANVPEYLGDQIGLLINSSVPTMSKAMSQIADLLEEKLNE